jgi:hypothetical protein
VTQKKREVALSLRAALDQQVNNKGRFANEVIAKERHQFNRQVEEGYNDEV